MGCELIICEALMGLFDGVPGPPGRTGSSADVAAALGWPILLVLDVSGQSQSAAAIVKGCASYDKRLTIAGVVLNRVGSPRHARLATEAIEALGIPVVGALPRSDDIALPERHLGLVQAGEHADLAARLARLADAVETHCDVDAIVAAAARLDRPGKPGDDAHHAATQVAMLAPPGQRIALASDAAFSFMYAHLLDGWRRAGAEIVTFSPLADQAPPDDCDVCWLQIGRAHV